MDVTVPHHWRSMPEFETSDGPLLYRRRFETPPATDPGRRSWLHLDGLFYQGDVWLDRSYVGDTEGYFFPHSFEVTDASVRPASTSWRSRWRATRRPTAGPSAT